ncbi:MAG: tetratricopeptide repeat protein [Candidatus Thorarchaeota archaeon]|nr:MAG: tetratricopeptide repeat protein [Candidatus Thorarchaeota archaeon]
MSLDGLTVDELIAKARSLRQQGQNKMAIETYRIVLGKEPENLDILNEMGLAHIHIGEQSDAIIVFDLAISIAPKDYRGHSNKTEAYLTIGEFEVANTTADAGLKILPKNSELWIKKARSLESLLQIEDAIAAYNQALLNDSGDPETWKALALCLDAQEKWAAVARAYRIAAGLHSKRGEMQDADSCEKFAQMAEHS